MNKLNRIFSLAVAVFIAACSDSDNVAGIPPPPPTSSPTDFTMFVKDQFSTTSDATDPIDVDNADFAFSDDDNAAAFDDLLQ